MTIEVIQYTKQAVFTQKARGENASFHYIVKLLQGLLHIAFCTVLARSMCIEIEKLVLSCKVCK